jgi:putative acetyltransferase
MQIRRYKKSDIAAIARLYYQTVHFINSRDYPEEQISAWAPRIDEDSLWRIRFKKHQVYVAEQDGASPDLPSSKIPGISTVSMFIMNGRDEVSELS